MVYDLSRKKISSSPPGMSVVGDVMYEGVYLPRTRILLTTKNSRVFYALDCRGDHHVELASSRDDVDREDVERMVARLYARSALDVSIPEAISEDSRKISGLHQRIKNLLERDPELAVN
ncbi:MAG: hypothetical protein ABIJ21_07045 [Nanoarchaeota archaeon]